MKYHLMINLKAFDVVTTEYIVEKTPNWSHSTVCCVHRYH